jgi:hypothetical protein
MTAAIQEQRGLRVPASAIAIAAFFALVALPRPAIPLIDGDVFWHIRAGETVLREGAVPTRDTWSIVGEGMRWVSQDWLANVMLALGDRLGDIGPTVLSFAWAALASGALVVLWIAYGRRRPMAGWLGRIVWLAAGLIVAGPTLGVRVQVLDLLLAAGVLLVLWTYLADRRARALLALPLLALAWANLHAGWPMLFLLGGAVVAGESLDRLLRRAPDGPTLTWRQIGWLAAALLVSVPVIALNPNGLALYRYPIDTSLIAAHRDFLSEWQPPDPGTFIGQVFIGFGLLVVLPAAWLGRRRLRLADLLVLLGLTVMTASSARFLLLAPLTAATAGLVLEPSLGQTRLGQRFGPALRRLGVPRRRRSYSVVNLVLVGVVALAGLLVTWARVGPAAQDELIPQHMPVAAVDWIVANDPGDRPFNQYSWGGYLGYRQPDEAVYIDGRSDIYGDAPIREYASVVRLQADPGPVLDRYQIDYVLMPSEGPLADWLDASEAWERAYDDPLAAVWVRTP